MRKTLRWLVPLSVLISATGTAAVATAAQPETSRHETDKQDAGRSTDIKDRLLAIKGMSLIEEKPYKGHRFFVLNYTQPVDHHDPSKGTFQQRITVLHKNTNRPTVFSTSGYDLYTKPSRSEPTQIIDGNEVSMEYRFFTPSRPSPADWSKLTIWQAASDEHRIFEALKPVYGKKWLATGASKGGMTATYFERFYPRDMDGVVAYVAPNDVNNDKDAAYDRFFEKVGTKECREKIQDIQREALVRRGPMERLFTDFLDKKHFTLNTLGTVDKAYEATVMDFTWGFWQYHLLSDCDKAPDAKSASDKVLFDYINEIGDWSGYTDQGLEQYTPYYYQAGTQLGSPDIKEPWLGTLSRYDYQPPRNFVPSDIPMKFDTGAMRKVDSWVRHHAHHMMWVYGQNDPWGSERFRIGKGAKDSYVFTAPGANHGADVAGLVAAEKAKATARILTWAGVAPAAVKENPSQAKPLARSDAQLDRREAQRDFLRP